MIMSGGDREDGIVRESILAKSIHFSNILHFVFVIKFFSLRRYSTKMYISIHRNKLSISSLFTILFYTKLLLKLYILNMVAQCDSVFVQLPVLSYLCGHERLAHVTYTLILLGILQITVQFNSLHGQAVIKIKTILKIKEI